RSANPSPLKSDVPAILQSAEIVPMEAPPKKDAPFISQIERSPVVVFCQTISDLPSLLKSWTTGAEAVGTPLRTTLLSVSAMKRTPARFTATPVGVSNRANVPVPSVAPDVPALPPIVVTTPAGEILRISLFAASAT